MGFVLVGVIRGDLFEEVIVELRFKLWRVSFKKK